MRASVTSYRSGASGEVPVGEYELFTLGLAIAVVMIVGRSVASRLEIPDA